MSDIFISYASEDRDWVKPLAEALATQGWSVWWDREIPFGKAFDQVIKEALSDARCIVVVWSNNSIKSDWVIEEAQYGRERKILVPVLLDDPHDGLPPFGFRRLQGANLQGWDGTDTHPVFQKLVADITGILGPAPAEEKDAKQATTGEQPAGGHVKRGAEEIPVPSQQHISTVSFTSKNIKFVSLISFGWATGWAISGAISLAIGMTISAAIMGAIGGLATGYALKQIEPSIQRKQIVIVTIGWAIGGAIGVVIMGDIGDAIYPKVGVAIGWGIGGATGGATGGAIGGAIMLWCLRPVLPKSRNSADLS